MGVHGLWDLLAPVGRRVSVETLAGKRLAIDASIWMVQFMKAMRDERGEMVRNAHVLGFFRRICKLLFLRTKPVFVFDGGTPALKRRTVIARRRQRENAQAKIRKTAEKMLLNQVNAMKLKQLDDNLQDQKDMNNSKGKEVLLDESDILKKTDAALEGHQEMIDEMLAASIQAEESGDLGTISSCVADIGSSSGNVSASSAAAFPQVDEEDESDEEMILPITDGNVDPAVLAALPPSMQLDLLVQMRERLMAENRQKYQKVKKAPKKFSELQIEAYLKTVAFRREIDQVQKAAAGKGVGGVQTSRIASETNREFIFSTSFSGDKQLLASGEAEKISEIQPMKEKKDSFFDILKAMASATKSTPEAEPAVDEAVQAFIDERRHRRVSSRRAMGIRMTRDLQRNIDLMKELEQESENHNIEANNQINLDMEGHLVESLCNGKSLEAVDDINCDIVQNSIVHSSLELKSHKDALMSDTFIEISFEDDMEQRSLDGDDEVFAHLVAGEQLPICSADNTTSGCEWEDGMISGESESLVDGNELGTNSLHVQYQNTNEFDVEWEDGTSLMSDKCNVKSLTVEDSKDEEIGEEWQDGTAITDIHGNASDVQKTVSKGSVEEAVALQEAIRRSLEDSTGGKSNSVSFDQKADDYACNSQLQLDGCSLLPCSYLERVLDGRQQSQYPVNEYDHSNFIAGKNTCSMHSTSGASVVTGPVPPIDKNDFNELQFSTSTGNALVSNLSKNGFSDLTDVATGGPATPHKSNVDAITNDRTAPTCDSGIVSEYSVGQTSFLEKQAVHSDLKKTVANDGSGHVSMQERSHDVEISASKDEDKTYESMGFSLEDELLVLDQEYKNLGDEQKRLGRNADSVNAEMFVECQELLQMFGLPYIIAPMEAEAQCAYMELANLVDGVVTDDSDVFLFGAQNVYKNIFDDRKYVETYFMKDIESELGLNREKLIRMALLLGSDYTEGVSGIGIVNAIEVLNAFPEEDGFHKFREWIESPDPSILGKVNGLSSKKKGSKASKNGMSKSKSDVEGNSDSDILLEHEDNDTRNVLQNMRQTFMNKHRNVSKNWHLPVSFPSDAVISAYAAPQVDKSTEPFAWGKPDIFSLRRLCWEKLGWANQKADELLLPVLKEYNKHETQLRLEAFYTFNERFAKIRSKRIKQAVKGITGKKSLNLDKGDDLLENPAKLKRTEAPASGNKSKRSLLKTKDRVAGERNNNSAQKLKSQQEKGNKGLPTEVESMGLCTGAFTKSISNTGRSRVRGRGKRTAVGRGQQKEHSDSECDETILHDQSSNSDEHEHEVLAENMELPDSVRRSKRARKAANYLEEDEESDEVVTPPNRMNGNCSDDRTGGQTSPQCLSVHGADVANAREERESTFEDLPGHRVPEDYLVTGGGFCVEEDKAEIESNQLANLGSTQRDTAIVDADSVYLQMGGGFCVDDDDDLDIGEGDGGVASTYTDACVSTTFTRTEESGLTIDPCEIATAPESVPATVEGLRKGPLLDSKLTLGYNNQTTDGNMSTVAPPTNKAAPTSVNPFSSLPIFKRKKKKVKKP